MKTIKYIYTLVIPLCFILLLASCQSIEERMKENLRIETERQNREALRQEELRQEKEKREYKYVKLSKEDAYNEIIKYNKIYRWNYLHIKDSNYEPAKKYRNDSPELRISPFLITLNYETSDVIDYEVGIVKNDFEVNEVNIFFELKNGTAIFTHNLSNSKYHFYVHLKTNISMSCSDDSF